MEIYIYIFHFMYKNRNLPPPLKKHKVEESPSEIPDVLQGEIARLDQRFKVCNNFFSPFLTIYYFIMRYFLLKLDI